MRYAHNFCTATLLSVVSLLFLAPFHVANAYTFSVLYTFQGGSDGQAPNGHLYMDDAGNLYGTTFNGGIACTARYTYGCGTAYELTPDGTHRVLHDFGTGQDGRFPESLTHDKSGVFYGSTVDGGWKNRGTVFALSPDGSEAVLHSFNGRDGSGPSSLVTDSDSNLYGTSIYGGSKNCGCGLAFKVAPDGTDTTLYKFQGGNDGANPSASLIKDKANNLYGTTFFGGRGDCFGSSGCGTVFELTRGGTKSILYAFLGSSDGGNPAARLAMDSAGNLYGTTSGGGAYGYGVVFKLTPDGTESVMHSFGAGTDGWWNASVRYMGDSGNLYGTTYFGGGGTGCGDRGCGTVFSIASDGTETILYAFTGGRDGAGPDDWLITDSLGNLYGAAAGGGAGCKDFGGCGTLFKLAP